MTASQIVGLIVFIAAIAGGMAFYLTNPNLAEPKEVSCDGAVAALPLVNTTTGMGMSVAIEECD